MRLLRWAVRLALLALILGGAAVFAMFEYYGRDLPDTASLAEYEPPVTTHLLAGDGRLIAEYAAENRLFVPIEAIPPLVVQAFVSAEDQNFYSHPGIDPQGVLRALVNNVFRLIEGRRMEGFSGITQQVARIFLLTNDYSVERKIREMILALRIESAYSKDEILELYLNQIYLGRGAYGVAAAALAYFDKALSELTLPEIAFLAGLPKAPSSYDPRTNPAGAEARRNYVIGRLLEDGEIDAEAAEAARQGPVVTADRRRSDVYAASYFAEEVRRQLQAIYGTDQVYEGGLSVRTTLDPVLQEIADRALREGLLAYDRRHGWRGPVARLETFDDWAAQLDAVARPAGAGSWQLAVVLAVDGRRAEIGFVDGSRGMIDFEGVAWARPHRDGQRVGPAPDSVDDVLALGDVILVEPSGPVPADPDALQAFALRQVPDVQGAVVVLDPNTGRVLAVSGGWDYGASQFNRATQAMRQPGSTFKPFVYLAALEAGYTPATIVDDAPVTVDLPGGQGVWNIASSNMYGPVPMRFGVEHSRNAMTVRLLQAVGLQPVRDVARRFGIYPDMPLLYSSALGALETTPLAMTTAFAMVANGGRRIEPTFIDRIQDRTGATVYRHDDRHCAECTGVAWSGQPTPVLPDTREQVTDPMVAYQLTSMLQGVVERGTGRALAELGVTLAGKTGTTNEAKDAWFVGFAPDLAVGVYVGFDEPRTLGTTLAGVDESGASAALPIFRAVMDAALDDQSVPPFRIPPGISLVRIDRLTGRPAIGAGGDVIWEAFRPGTEPGTGYALDRLWAPGDTIPGETTSFGDSLPEATTGTGGLY